MKSVAPETCVMMSAKTTVVMLARVLACAWLALALTRCARSGSNEGAAKPVAVKPAPPPAPPVDDGPPVRLFASRFASKVRAAPTKEAKRRGYLRGGAVLMATTSKPVGFEDCRKGWYELETGGFACATADVTPFTGKRLPARRPTQPVFDKPMPYPYGYSKSKNTPVYRRLPTDEEAAQYEGYKIPGLVVTATDAGVVPVPSPPAEPGSPATPSNAPGGQPVFEAQTSTSAATATVSAPEIAGNPGAGEPEPEGPPTLASLMGDQGSVLMRRMERGFYVSLDREISKGARSYWQTQSTGFIPKSRLWMVEPSEFHGVELKAEPGAADAGAGVGVALPIAFVMSKNVQAYALDAKGRIHGAGHPGYHFMFPIASTATFHDKEYYVGPNGTYYPEKDVTRVEARERPPEVGVDEKWIDVNLTTQSLVAYVGDRPVYATLISSGRVKDELDPLRNFVTPVGSFRITAKHVTATMDGDHALDGPYSIEDVPYVMYFQLAYALHAAFWHNSFGRPHSHGCVNLAPTDAKWLFLWATPTMPEHWHGVYPTDKDLGTRVYVHGDTPKG